MSDYTELIQELRHYFDGVPLVLQAADAIEELATNLQLTCNNVATWIPAKERLPQEEKEYWCFCRGGAWKQLSWMDRYFWNGERFELPWGGEYDEVTHWMPLPTPPKEGEG